MPSSYTNRLEQGLLVFKSTYFAIGTSGYFTDEIHHFATYSKGLPQPLLKPPQKRGIHFAKILGL
jgi:hypothetical protein